MSESINSTLPNTASTPKELMEYLINKFVASHSNSQEVVSITNIQFWESLIEKTKIYGVFNSLKNCYPQLCFPIEQDICLSEEYKNATLKGQINTNANNEIGLIHPDDIELKIHNSISGKIPVLIIPNNKDFIKIIQALLYKNNPANIPDSMGASFVNGLNNWARLNELKHKWMEKNPFGNWGQEFINNIKPEPSKFKDQLIILSTKPYSNIKAQTINLSDEEWTKYSFTIRLEHECTHLFTLNKFGVMSNNLHDELIADYIGICKAFGSFNKEWMLHFMGLENYPVYRKSARLENYLGDLNNSQKTLELLIPIIKKAIDNIAVFDDKLGIMKSEEDQQQRIESLCNCSLAEIASEKGSKILASQYSCSYST